MDTGPAWPPWHEQWISWMRHELFLHKAVEIWLHIFLSYCLWKVVRTPQPWAPNPAEEVSELSTAAPCRRGKWAVLFQQCRGLHLQGVGNAGVQNKGCPPKGAGILPLLCFCWEQPGEQDQRLEQRCQRDSELPRTLPRPSPTFCKLTLPAVSSVGTFCNFQAKDFCLDLGGKTTLTDSK